MPADHAATDLDVVLEPISWPGLSDIKIDGQLIMGRTEPPLTGYDYDVVRKVSRKHARIHCAPDGAYLSDLGSQNGTTVNGSQVSQAPHKLADGDEIGLGGELTYRISIQRRLRAVERPVTAVQPAEDKTRFLDSPMPFLHLLSNAAQPQGGVSSSSAVVARPDGKPPVIRERERIVSLVREFVVLDTGHKWKAATAIVLLGALALATYFWNASERNLEKAIARGEYAQAATLADSMLREHPDDIQLRERAVDAALKASVSVWLPKLKARDFDGAQAALAVMSGPSSPDAELRSLQGELAWVGDLERLIDSRGGPDAPIRIYSDEQSIERFIDRWNEDTAEHQRALSIIAAHVPQFGNWYGEALTHIRQLQSESAVYLPVVLRVKADIDTQLQRDNPEALDAILAQTADQYPGLGGLDDVRQDLARYLEIRREARNQGSDRLFELIRTARFRAPPFEQSVRELTAGAQLPSAELMQQYAAATKMWENGDSAETFAELQPLTTGPWGSQLAAELERRRGVAARFAALDASGAENSVDQLLAFAESLDADQDAYFSRAAAADLRLQRTSVMARAQDAMSRARALWQEYRDDGAINAAQRDENSISTEYRTRARQLAQAREYARQSLMIYSQLDMAAMAPGSVIRSEIETEATVQRQGLNELGNVLAPALLKAKLELIGDSPR
jgi:hypothetical protein